MVMFPRNMLSLFPESQHPLPEFHSLLVVGPCHASGPLYLALSYARAHSDARPIIISPSREILKESLARLGDSWLARKSRCGNMLEEVSRIEML